MSQSAKDIIAIMLGVAATFSMIYLSIGVVIWMTK